MVCAQVGDQILEISGRITENASHAEVVDLIQNGGPMIRVVAKRTSVTLPQTCEYSVLISLHSISLLIFINAAEQLNLLHMIM